MKCWYPSHGHLPDLWWQRCPNCAIFCTIEVFRNLRYRKIYLMFLGRLELSMWLLWTVLMSKWGFLEILMGNSCTEIWRHRDLSVLQVCFCLCSANLFPGREGEGVGGMRGSDCRKTAASWLQSPPPPQEAKLQKLQGTWFLTAVTPPTPHSDATAV